MIPDSGLLFWATLDMKMQLHSKVGEGPRARIRLVRLGPHSDMLTCTAHLAHHPIDMPMTS